MEIMKYFLNIWDGKKCKKQVKHFLKKTEYFCAVMSEIIRLHDHSDATQESNRRIIFLHVKHATSLCSPYQASKSSSLPSFRYKFLKASR